MKKQVLAEVQLLVSLLKIKIKEYAVNVVNVVNAVLHFV